MDLLLDVNNIVDFPEEERPRLAWLVKEFRSHKVANDKKQRYYEGRIPLGTVNLGIALPDTLKSLEIGCAWGAKTVDVLAARSMFDGFVGANGQDVPDLDKIVEGNDLITAYEKACRDELEYGCDFATLSGDGNGAKIRFHSPQTASAHWNGELGRIDFGFAVIATEVKDEVVRPTLINYMTDDAIYVLTRVQNSDAWKADKHTHKMGRILMEPLTWNATSNKPFGRSRIKEPVRRLIDGYVRTMANATIGLEFATSPQKYLLGVTDEQYDAVVNAKFQQYVGSILTSTNNPETGEKPTFGQLSQGSLTPHVEMLRMLATQFSAATGLSVTDTGVVNDANPTSSDAILAQSQTLVCMAEQLNSGNGNSLKNIAIMALAIKNDKTFDEVANDTDIVAHFKNPAMPSVAMTADAAIKIASARPAFASTDTFLEMIGFDKADIRRIKSQEQKTRGLEVLDEIGVE